MKNIYNIVYEPTASEILQQLGINLSLNISNKETELIQSRMKKMSLSKGEKFINEGHVCRKLAILVKGLLYSYYELDEKIVSRFFYLPKNIVVTDFKSFKKKTKSTETIEALEDSYLFYFTNEDIKFLYKEVPIMNYIGREFAEESYISCLDRKHELQSLNTEQRFEVFFQENSELFNRVKIKDIASYLRMNRNLVSRYMKKINFAT